MWQGANMILVIIKGMFSKITPHKINNSDGTIDNNSDFRKLFSFQNTIQPNT